MRGLVVRARALSRALPRAGRGDRACASGAGAAPGGAGQPQAAPGGAGQGRALRRGAVAAVVVAAGAAGGLYAYSEQLKAEAAEAQRRQGEEEARRRLEQEAAAARAAEDAAARQRAEEALARQREELEAVAALERERHERHKEEDESEEGAAARQQAVEEQRRQEEERRVQEAQRLRLEEEQRRLEEEERLRLEEERRRLEEEAARRAAALEALEAAVARRDPAACREALGVARGAGLDAAACPRGRLAAALAEPAQLNAGLLAVEQADQLAELRSHAPGIGAEDFVMAAAVCASAADGEESLRRKAGELAAALQRNCGIHLASLEARLAEAQGMLRERCAVRVDSALERLAAERRLAEGAQRSALQQEADLRTGEDVASRLARVRSEAAAEREALCEEFAGRTSGHLAAQSEALAKRLDNLGAPVGSLEELLSSGESLQRRSQASSALTRALLALEAALAAGRNPTKELEALVEAGKDCREFLPAALAPAAAAGAAGVVATKEQLRRSFGERLPQMASSALAPPAGGGLLAHLCAHAAGRALASLYDFRAAADLGAERALGAEVAQWNLALLATASELVEVGDFAGALEALEQLTGVCREYARAAWGGEARRTLLLQQAARAAQAEARCLNASLR